jgi:Capsular polysaccharide synthesis protein
MLLLVIILFIILIGLIIYTFFYNKRIEGFTSSIPQIIWTFWDNENVPDVVQKCIHTWETYNPQYKIIVLSKTNLTNYLDVDFSKIKHISDSCEKYSDMVRLHILSKYGGIWCDASVICMKSYDSWIPYIQAENDADFVGFYIDSFTLPEFKKSSPVIENWFFACKKNSIMVNDWLKEFLRISDYDTVEQYVDSVKAEGVNIQNISSPTYLSMHVACQKVLQKGENRPYKFALLKAEDTAFKYLTKNDWNSEKAVKNILDCKHGNKEVDNCDLLNTPIIKMRGVERKAMDTMDYSKMFL